MPAPAGGLRQALLRRKKNLRDMIRPGAAHQIPQVFYAVLFRETAADGRRHAGLPGEAALDDAEIGGGAAHIDDNGVLRAAEVAGPRMELAGPRATVRMGYRRARSLVMRAPSFWFRYATALVLPAVGQAADVGQLQGDVVHAVEKAGNDDLAAEELPLGKDLIHKAPGIGGFQHGDAGRHPGQAAVSPRGLCAAEGGQLEKLFRRDAHLDPPHHWLRKETALRGLVEGLRRGIALRGPFLPAGPPGRT